MKLIHTPNLPKADVSLVAVSAAYPGVLLKLKDMGIKVIPIGPRKSLPAPVQSHADILCHPLGDCRIVVAKGEETLISRLKRYGFQVTESKSNVAGPYPNDSALNAARVGGSLIANPEFLDRTILDDCFSNGIRIVEVRQGYAKCSTAVVDEESIMTSDDGIEAAAVKAGINVLKIHPGSIQLPGYSYGFIGGACGLIGRKKMAFAGNPSGHPDFYKMQKFFNCRKIEIIALSAGPLLDIGGMIPLMEREA